jgi:predicted regulator of Ras-like GTPase activity (Roadblock/LC7/MglB family)
MHQVLDHLVGQVPGVFGALVSSADGFTLASAVPIESEIEPASLGAMAAAAFALSNRLVSTVGESTATVTVHRSDDGQVLMLPISNLAVLTILAIAEADSEQLTRVCREATIGFERLFHGAATV